jgi:hypothetical protein
MQEQFQAYKLYKSIDTTILIKDLTLLAANVSQYQFDIFDA